MRIRQLDPNELSFSAYVEVAGHTSGGVQFVTYERPLGKRRKSGLATEIIQTAELGGVVLALKHHLVPR